MSSEGKYTVIELSEKLNVPRTTITDWLARYEVFVDFKIQGKRKIYTDKSVELLLEVKELRDKGLSSFDIEEELAKRHAIHGEFSGSGVAMPGEDEKKDEDRSKSSNVGGSALVNRNSINAEAAETLRSMLIEMTRRMDELEKQSRINLERSAKWNVAAFSTILILAAVSIFGFLMIRNITEEKEGIDKEKLKYLNMSQELSNMLLETKESKRLAEDKLIEIDGERSMLKTEMELLKTEVEKQKIEFENELQDAMGDVDRAKEAEMLALRDKFAEERLKLLEELDKAKKSREEIILMWAKVQEQMYSENSKEPEIPSLPPATEESKPAGNQ